MSAPDSGPSRRGASRPVHQPEPVTDPGRSQPFESLYRSTESRPRSHRTTARHFEPWLHPPEEEPDAGDTFGWLYRKEPEPPSQAPPEVPGSRATSAAASTLRPQPAAPLTSPRPAPATAQSRRTTSRRRRRVGWLGALLVLLMAVGAAVLLLLSGDLSSLASALFDVVRDT